MTFILHKVYYTTADHKTNQPSKTVTPSKATLKNEANSNQSKDNQTFLKWLPISLLETEKEISSPQLDLLQTLLSQDWKKANDQIQALGETVRATQATELLENIQTWQQKSVAYLEAQANLTQER